MVIKKCYQHQVEYLILYEHLNKFQFKLINLKGKSAVHDSCANFSTTEFQTDRGKYQESLREIMRRYCESLYCELNDLQVILILY